MLPVWSSWSCHATMHTKEEQSRSDRISTAYAVSSSLESHTSIYVGVIFLSIRTIGFRSTRSEDPGPSLRDDISS